MLSLAYCGAVGVVVACVGFRGVRRHCHVDIGVSLRFAVFVVFVIVLSVREKLLLLLVVVSIVRFVVVVHSPFRWWCVWFGWDRDAWR